MPPWARIALQRWTAQAWTAAALTAGFIAITCWWLTQDHSIPIFDAGYHLRSVIEFQRDLSAGHLSRAVNLTVPYPPLPYLVGAFGIWVAGVDVAPPILAENLVFVPLLALGCYHVGRLAFGRTAGLLAVAFALGSPLITAQFHVFMTDAPETAMVAVGIWAILASERFSRVGVSAVAGLAVGLGMLTKEPFAVFVVGVVLVSAVRGGRRAWRGLLAFALVALLVALPWYVHEFSQVNALGSGAVNAATHSGTAADIAPGRLSLDNLEWYSWNFVNFQLYLPLFLMAAAGWLWTLAGFVRRRPVSPFAVELALGSFLAWVAITETFVHDTRYSMPMLLYLAVFGTGWIVRLPGAGRAVATAALMLVVAANTLAVSFGVGGVVSFQLPGAHPARLQAPGVVRIYSNSGYLVAGPHRDGDLLGTLRALKRNGVTEIVWNGGTFEADFSTSGLRALAQIAGLAHPDRSSAASLTRQDAYLAHAPRGGPSEPPCVRLSDGTGIWIRLGDPFAPGSRDYCPSHNPQFYGP